jgi:hypothetical protein
MFVCCECCVLSGRGLCDGLIIRPDESYRLWRVVVCDRETSHKRGGQSPLPGCENTPTVGCNARKTNNTQQTSAIIFVVCILFVLRFINTDSSKIAKSFY